MRLLLAHKGFDAVHDQHGAWLVGAVYSGAVEQSTFKDRLACWCREVDRRRQGCGDRLAGARLA